MGKIILPNVRKLFVPDPGYMLFEADLAGADAQVVAAEAADHDLLSAFRSGVDIHAKNAADMAGAEFTSLAPGSHPWEKLRKQYKQFCHGTNYGGGVRTIATTLGWTESDVRQRQWKWFNIHPGIKQWHRNVEAQLKKDRTIKNRFGYHIIYFDRIEGLLPQALAWIPQSTVAIITRRAMLQLPKVFPEVQILLQVHDSLVFQLPLRLSDQHHRIIEGLRISVPYDPPLVIPWTLSKSPISWGDMKKVA